MDNDKDKNKVKADEKAKEEENKEERKKEQDKGAKKNDKQNVASKEEPQAASAEISEDENLNAYLKSSSADESQDGHKRGCSRPEPSKKAKNDATTKGNKFERTKPIPVPKEYKTASRSKMAIPDIPEHSDRVEDDKTRVKNVPSKKETKGGSKVSSIPTDKLAPSDYLHLYNHNEANQKPKVEKENNAQQKPPEKKGRDIQIKDGVPDALIQAINFYLQTGFRE